jgi:hypothetical protein
MPTPSDTPEFAQAIITGYLDRVHQYFNILILGTVLFPILLPLLFALFAFSTQKTRRSIIFMKCVIDITLGLVLGIYNIYVEVSFASFVSFSPFTKSFD